MAGERGGADGERGGDGEAGERGGVERGEGLQGHAGGRRLGSHGWWWSGVRVRGMVAPSSLVSAELSLCLSHCGGAGGHCRRLLWLLAWRRRRKTTSGLQNLTCKSGTDTNQLAVADQKHVTKK